jgi:hypothetical protein
MKILLIVGILVVVLVIIVVGVGSILPVEHHVTREVILKSTPAKTWAIIVDFPSAPKWRKNLKSVEKVERDGEIMWKEEDQSGDSLLYRTLFSQEPKKLVREIVGPELPFGGTWTFVLEPHPEGAKLQITEDGKVYQPVYRFVSRFFLGHSRSLDLYLGALEQYVASAKLSS